MSRSIFTTSADQYDRKTSIQEGGAVSAELLKRCAMQASELTEVIGVLAYELGCTDETTSAKATAIEALAARIQTTLDKVTEFLDEDDRDCSKIDDLVAMLSPSWQLRNQQYDAICTAEARAARSKREAASPPCVGGLSKQAIAEIGQMALQVRELADIFNADGRLVDILDHAADVYDIAAKSGSVTDALNVLINAESFLHGARMLAAHDQQFSNSGLAALLETIAEKANSLSESFDGKGVHVLKEREVTAGAPASREAVAA